MNHLSNLKIEFEDSKYYKKSNFSKFRLEELKLKNKMTYIKIR